jgi:hypothetical protein
MLPPQPWHKIQHHCSETASQADTIQPCDAQEDHLEAPLLPYPDIEGNANQELATELAEPATADAHDEPRTEIVQNVAPEQDAVEPEVQNAPLEAPAAEQPAAAAEDVKRRPEEAADDSSEQSFGVIVADVDYSGYVPSLWGIGFAGGAFPYDEAMQG